MVYTTHNRNALEAAAIEARVNSQYDVQVRSVCGQTVYFRIRKPDDTDTHIYPPIIENYRPNALELCIPWRENELSVDEARKYARGIDVACDLIDTIYKAVERFGIKTIR
ncbi:MAG: hypothetical protein J6Y20_07460 [Lachnospiraceae bacterium]|nr:hypothetical protein [Lachnospiraceae bacterium]